MGERDDELLPLTRRYGASEGLREPRLEHSRLSAIDRELDALAAAGSSVHPELDAGQPLAQACVFQNHSSPIAHIEGDGGRAFVDNLRLRVVSATAPSTSSEAWVEPIGVDGHDQINTTFGAGWDHFSGRAHPLDARRRLPGRVPAPARRNDQSDARNPRQSRSPKVIARHLSAPFVRSRLGPVRRMPFNTFAGSSARTVY